ncbi:MAG: TonB-dependent receptor family protein [Planctomycetota bacterium]|jgi:Fe(3+) dicitrate transport protein
MKRCVAMLLGLCAAVAADDALDESIHHYLNPAPDDEVVVEADKVDASVPTERLEETGSHGVLTPERVRDATPTTVDEIARRLPGVSSRLYSGDEHLRPSISMRGMPDNGFTEYTAVHVDGINFSTLIYGWTALSIFPFTAERIFAAEVRQGAHAIRQGPNTIAGVVNFVTRPIPDRPTLDVDTMFASYDYMSSRVLLGNTWKSGWGGLLEYVQKGGDTFRQDAEFDVSEGALKLRKTFKNDAYLQLNAFHWRDTHQLAQRLTRQQLEEDPSQNPSERRIDWNGWAYGTDLMYRNDLADGSWYYVRGYFRKARRALDSGRPRTGPPFDSVRNADSDNYNTGIELRGEQELGAGNRLHYGARYHYEQIDRQVFQEFDDGTPTDLQSDTKTWTHALSAHIDDTFTWKRMTVVVGLRLEYIPEMKGEDAVSGNSQTFDLFEVLPGLSANYLTTENTAVFVNYHHSFRAPQTWSFDYTGKPQDFEFENGKNAELGWRWTDAKGDSGSIAVWWIDFSNFIDFDDLTETFRNLGGFESYGITLTVDHDFGAQGLEGFSVFGTATYQHSEFTEGQYTGNDTPFVPSALFSGGLRYAHRTGLYGVFEGYYLGSSEVTPENDIQTPGYWLFDLRLGWRTVQEAGHLRITIDLAIGAKNLFDEDYYLQHNATQFVPGTPRTLFGQVVVRVEF